MEPVPRLQRLLAHILPAANAERPLSSAPSAATGNRQIIVASVPKGSLKAVDFAPREAPAPEPAEGEVLVRVLAITIGAGQRAGLQGSASYAGAARSGVLMGGTGVGRVEASRDKAFSVGDLVVGQTGWQELAALPGNTLTKVAPGTSPATQLGALGTNGLTAYFGLLEIGKPQQGETVVVSAAAGSVGHLVGQMAKIKGARVVGIAGSDEKCKYLTDEIGFDAALNYKRPTFRDDFKAATPKRIDVYFDNVGGEILGSALFRMNTYGRIVCCGNASQYDTAAPGPGPRGIPGLLVNNQVRMEGFIVYRYGSRYGEARSVLTDWIKSGKLKARTTEYHGLVAAPQAFVDMLAGRTVGTTVVHVAPER